MAQSPKSRSGLEFGFWLGVVGLAAWIVPGAGHFLIREKKRAIIIFLVITALFMTGLYAGSIGIINQVAGGVWFYAQVLISPVVGLLAQVGKNYDFPNGRPCDVGQIYTGIAGLLNLLCILNAVYMAYCGHGELIGEEEQEQAND